ncbi:bifunctional glutamate N-acetyltransferase/amino-acid acetyltransferase ArgJ [Marisediminicola antarctica]|uniref:Arginine biosynthesis bifunctional protein ArgJ n=1 Tax=Marisediminicola antarctica TaxID=674079 RepID=A0A7L5AK28_9MICO|nr:bifunctional glutamate N-acetyltransferase/amino-acid acetyltransferase ArgJ [Marisediminicola antarctica]QHO70412.1 bifunctional ornithine acetyltransferase/N-acetylglutamate synthase [Marisediminicola antarctica]
MSVTHAKGFAAVGLEIGLKNSGGKDLALVHNLGPRNAAAAVFTSNRAKANPIIWSQQVIADGIATAIVLNSGGANCYTGSRGFQVTHATAEAVAAKLDLSTTDVLVCSTGLIGEQLPLEPLLAGIETAQLTADGGADAALAIMTTDSHPKTSVVDGAGWSIGGMAKGAGMLAPGLATMLVVLTTDADVPASDLDAALRSATRVSFDRLDSDGCMSTNDQVTLLASGASGIVPDAAEFRAAVTTICLDLALQLQADAEGSSHDISIETVNAANEDDAVMVGRSVARNNLFKAAVFGNDPNWGRVLAAVGTTSATFDPYDIDVSINGVMVCRSGEPGQSRDLVDLAPRAVHVLIDLKSGTDTATVWTNDLTHDYVHENSAYSS